MPFVPGSTVVGSFHAIPISLAKPGVSSISTLASGKGNLCIVLNSLSLRTKKPSMQARRRKQPTLPVAAGRSMRVEHEYFREGAWTYLAAWDVHRAKIFGHCEKKSGIAPTNRLIAEVMRREPYKSAKRVFWIMDNCSAHRGQKAVERVR